jgi:hypothetical protein
MTLHRTRLSLALAAPLLALLTACGSVGGGGLGSGGLSEPLEAQRALMSRTFENTPVAVSAAGGELKVTVPLKHSFSPKQFAVRPALAKVLEKLAPGVVRNPNAVLSVLQPADEAASPNLLRERRESLQDMLRGLGVPANRLQVSTDTATEASTVMVVSEGAR